MEKKECCEKDKINLGKEGTEECCGSALEGEERDQRKYDDWRAHCHEKDRDIKHEFREGELHGVVGKEIHDALLLEKKNQQKEQEELKNLKKHHEIKK
jgi:hypothetical protein